MGPMPCKHTGIHAHDFRIHVNGTNDLNAFLVHIANRVLRHFAAAVLNGFDWLHTAYSFATVHIGHWRSLAVETKPIVFTLPTSGWAFTDIGGTGVSGRVGVAVPLPSRRAGASTRPPAESRHLADFLPAGQGPMPIGVCAADLAESNDPRERRAGARNPYRTHHGIQQGNEQ